MKKFLLVCFCVSLFLAASVSHADDNYDFFHELDDEAFNEWVYWETYGLGDLFFCELEGCSNAMAAQDLYITLNKAKDAVEPYYVDNHTTAGLVPGYFEFKRTHFGDNSLDMRNIKVIFELLPSSTATLAKDYAFKTSALESQNPVWNSSVQISSSGSKKIGIIQIPQGAMGMKLWVCPVVDTDVGPEKVDIKIDHICTTHHILIPCNKSSFVGRYDQGSQSLMIFEPSVSSSDHSEHLK